MKIVGNVTNIEVEQIDGSDGAPMTTLLLGRAAGSQKLYANIDRLQPGAKSCKLHSHSHQEEFFLILRGACSVVIGEQSYRVKEGSFLAKPAGQGIAHQFINDSDGVVEILDVGTVDPRDVIDYPNEGVTYIPAQRRAWKNGQELASWSSDPNARSAGQLEPPQSVVSNYGIRVVPINDEHRLLIKERTEELFGGSMVVSKGVLHEPANLPGFIAFRDEDLVGLATYSITGTSCELVTIDALIQQQGIGTALLVAVEAKAKEAGCQTTWLITTNDNLDALRFYQRRGYRLTALHPDAIAHSRALKPSIPKIGNFGIAIRDEIELQKTLEPNSSTVL